MSPHTTKAVLVQRAGGFLDKRSTHHTQVCIVVIQMLAANAGNRVVHMTPEDKNERTKQRFITHVIYSEIGLLSSIICSLGWCSTPLRLA